MTTYGDPAPGQKTCMDWCNTKKPHRPPWECQRHLTPAEAEAFKAANPCVALRVKR